MNSLLWAVVLGCVNTPPPPAPQARPTAPVSAEQTPSVEPVEPEADCMKACLRQNMARAIAADVIEADCLKSCSAKTDGLLEQPALDPSL